LPEHVLAAPPASRRRLAPPDDPAFRAALAGVAEHAAPASPPLRRTVSTWRLLRLGLREFAAGMASVLLLGVLNRVMKVELGISLAVVAAVLASYNLAAPFALAIGHRSDTRPIFGRRRIPYILGGTAVSALAVATAPHAAGLLVGGLSPMAVVVAVLLFVAMGVGMYGSGTVFFALLADITSESERGHAASIVYLELMGGILAGVALTSVVLDNGIGGLGTLFAIAGLLVFALTSIAVWGQERDTIVVPATGPRVTFAQTLKSVAAIRQARIFFGFMVAATVFLFLQQAVLEPFGGDVLGLSVRATSAFNAVQTIGVLVGMVLAGRAMADRAGHKRMAAAGLVAAAVAFAALAAAALAESVPASWMAILGVGLATGLINVATLALMMGMADAKRVALFMGAWTVAHAIADGVATAGGGAVFDVARRFAGSDTGAYATVFVVEAIGLALCLPLLRRVDPGRFAQEAAGTPDPVSTPGDEAPPAVVTAAAPAATPDVIRLPD
jgi:BCD family chlorophyll transporter-like MFS transporter